VFPVPRQKYRGAKAMAAIVSHFGKVILSHWYVLTVDLTMRDFLSI